MNNYGFRNDYDIQKGKNKDIFRIIVIGGSAAWGSGATSNSTVWTAILENVLQKKATKKIQVLNAGCAGYVSFQESVYLQFKLLQFSPDLVIVLDGYNDLYMAALYDEKDYIENTSLYYNMHKRFFKGPLLMQIAAVIGERSHTCRLIKRIYEKILYESGRPMHPLKYVHKRGISNYFENIKSVSDILKGRDIKALFLLQPYLGTSNKVYSPDERQMLSKAQRESSYMIKLMNLLRTEYKRFAWNNNITYYDLNDMFDNIPYSQTLWYDHIHLNDKGQKILAEQIGKILFEKNLLSDRE